MSRSAVITCDVCLRVKQETNHWLIAFTRPGACGITFGRGADAALVPKRQKLVTEDIYGADCAHKKLSQWLTEQGIRKDHYDRSSATNQ